MLPVSVVIPTYNGLPYIAQALDSIFTQTVLPREIIVVDDASTDGTANLVGTIASSAPVPLRLVRLRNNSGGPSHPLNVGIAAAAHEFIAVLDQDDLFLPERLASMVPVLAADPRTAFVFSAYGSVGQPSRVVAPSMARAVVRRLLRAPAAGEAVAFVDGRTAARWLLAYGNYVVGYPGFLFRRSAWQQKGGLDESLRVSSDYDLLCWLCLQGSVAFVPRILALRRIHGRNLSTRGIRGYVDLGRVLLRYIEAVAPAAGDQEFWRQFGRHYLRMLVGLGWAGQSRHAARILWLANRAWGFNRETAGVLARLLFTSLYRCLRPALRVDRADCDQLLEHLDALRELCHRHLARAEAA